MTPEARIGFEIAIGAPSVFLILLRAWVLTRWKKNTFSNGITNAALYLTCLCVLATNGANIWSMSKIIQYRDRPNIVMESSTGLPMHLVGTGLKVISP